MFSKIINKTNVIWFIHLMFIVTNMIRIYLREYGLKLPSHAKEASVKKWEIITPVHQFVWFQHPVGDVFMAHASCIEMLRLRYFPLSKKQKAEINMKVYVLFQYTDTSLFFAMCWLFRWTLILKNPPLPLLYYIHRQK